jgi:hypothetical protein
MLEFANFGAKHAIAFRRRNVSICTTLLTRNGTLIILANDVLTRCGITMKLTIWKICVVALNTSTSTSIGIWLCHLRPVQLLGLRDLGQHWRLSCLEQLSFEQQPLFL